MRYICIQQLYQDSTDNVKIIFVDYSVTVGRFRGHHFGGFAVIYCMGPTRMKAKG